MATTEEYKNGGSASYSFSIEKIKDEDIKVSVDGTDLTYTATNPPAQTTEYTVNGSNVIFKQASVSGSATGGVRIYRETSLENADSATFVAGSAIRAADLNANHKLVRFAAQEKNQEIVTADIRDSQVTSAKILDGTIQTADIGADQITGALIPNDTINSEHYAALSIDTEHIANENVTTAKLAPDAVTSAKLADNAVNSEHYVDGSIDLVHMSANSIDSFQIVDGAIDHVHLAADIIDGDNIQDDVVNSEHIVAGALDNEHYAAGSITSDKLNGATVVTNSEQAASTPNDTSFFTTAAAEARYFNASTGETIKDGDTFPDNDTTIATTAAINDRILDIVDGVGGFVPLVDEGEIPQYHPEKENNASDRRGTILSIGTLTKTYTPSGGTVTILASDLTHHSVNATIVQCGTTVLPSGFGVLVETKQQTDGQYAAGPSFIFHRLVPKSTEVTTVAGVASNVTTVAGIAANTTTVAGISSDVTTVAGIASNVTSVANNTSNINSAVSNASNINSAVSNATNINTVAGSISNVNTAATNIASINNASANISSVNNFGDRYQVASSNPSTDGGGNALAEGDLYFNTTANELKVYNGGAWQGGVTASGSFAATTGNTFTGDNRYNDNAKALFGTGSDLEIFHNGSHSYILENGTGNLKIQSDQIIQIESKTGGEDIARFIKDGAVELYYDNSKKFETSSTGCTVTGNITLSGNVDGRDVAADGTKLDGIEASATADQTASEIVSLLSDQNITTTGALSSQGTFTLGGNYPQIFLQDANNDSDFKIQNSNGVFTIRDDTNSNNRFTIASAGQTTISGNLDVNNGLDVTGATTIDGNLTIDTSTPQILMKVTGDSQSHRYVHYNTADQVVSRIYGETDGELRLETAGTENAVVCKPNAAVELYNDGAKKFETTSTGILIENSSGPSTLSCKSSGSNGASLRALATGTGDAVVALDAANGDLSGADYANIRHRNDNLNLEFRNYANDIVFKNRSGSVGAGGLDVAIHCKADAAVELYHNGTKKFETSSGGATVTGDLTITDDLFLQDNLYMGDTDAIVIGDSEDLIIKHDGTHNFIQTGGADIIIYGTGEDLAKFIDDGAVELYHNGSKKFETTSSGATITGTVTATAFSGNGSNLTGISSDVVDDTSPQLGGDLQTNGNDIDFADSDKALFGNSGDFDIHHSGTYNYVLSPNGHTMIVESNQIQLRAVNNELYFKGIANGSAYLYHNGSEKLSTESWGVSFSGNVSPSANNTHDLGATSARWANVYTNDLHLSNEGSSNDVDGTWGDWTIQEGKSDLFLKNNRSGKKYKFNLMEVS